MKRGTILFVLFALFVLLAGMPAAAATILNGSLTGTVANGGVPPDWIILLETPDTNDIDHNVGSDIVFVVEPARPSPDGGTWVGLARDKDFIEAFGQTLTGLVIGGLYDISWYAGNFGYSRSLGYVEPNAIEVLIDGVSIGSGATLALGADWFLQSRSFTASAESQNLSFALAYPDQAYLSIDGIAVTNAVPEPASLLLLGAGLGLIGIAAWRGRK